MLSDDFTLSSRVCGVIPAARWFDRAEDVARPSAEVPVCSGEAQSLRREDLERNRVDWGRGRPGSVFSNVDRFAIGFVDSRDSRFWIVERFAFQIMNWIFWAWFEIVVSARRGWESSGEPRSIHCLRVFDHGPYYTGEISPFLLKF